MFVLVTELVAPWPVSIPVVRADGSVGTDELTLNFVRVEEDEFSKIFAAVEGQDADAVTVRNRQIFDRLVKGWSDVVDANKQPIPFTPEAVSALIRFPNFASAFTLAYVAFHRAQPAVREKNSGRSPAGPTAAAGPAETPTAASGSS